MRRTDLATTVLLSLACGCPAPHHDTSVPAPIRPEVREFAALAYIPDQPSYLLTAHTVKELQRSVNDVIDSFGMLAGVSARDAGRALEGVLGIDPLSESGAAKLGIDPTAAIALFSEATDPTFVVHLGAPETAHGYFDAERNHGRTQAIVIDGVELVTAHLIAGLRVTWAIDHDWLWVHFGFGLDKDANAEWFTHAHHATGAGWMKSFDWATQLRAKLTKPSGLVGFVDPRVLLALARTHAPHDALACLDRFSPIGLVGIAIGADVDAHHAGGRLAIDLGPSAQGIAAAIFPPPPGFEAIAQHAPFAVQWNLDLGAVASFVSPCLQAMGGNTTALTMYGVRTARAALLTLKPDDKSGTGVIAADLADKTYLDKLLDQIPKRSLFERDRTYGSFAGHRIAIPFLVTLDYVLDEHHGFVAVGDGLIDKLLSGATSRNSPIAALDLEPPAMSAEAWKFLITALSNEWFANAATERLQRWQDGHVRVTIEDNSLVIDASGNRR